MLLGQEDQGPQARLFQRGRQRERGVEAAADASVQHLTGIAHLLAGVGPTGRRLGVADAVRGRGLEDRVDDVVHPLLT
jgi:hypothetical protein